MDLNLQEKELFFNSANKQNPRNTTYGITAPRSSHVDFQFI